MERRIGYRMVLDVARQGAVRRAVELNVDEGREKAGPGERAPQLARLEADQHRGLLVAVDDRRDASLAPCRPGRALAGALARLGVEAHDLGHRSVTPLSKTADGGRPAHPAARAPPHLSVNQTGSKPIVPR